MTRPMMKKDARRRKRDGQDTALHGTGSGHGQRPARGLEDEFEDVLRAVGKMKAGAIRYGYEERQKAKKADALSRVAGQYRG